MEVEDRPDPPDVEKNHLAHLARGADYFADLGRGPRIAAAVAVAPFAAYLLLAAAITPIAASHFAWRGEWPMAWLMLGIGAGHGLVGLVLAWLTRRLWRGRPAANGRTVLPTWLVGLFLFGALTPMGVGMCVALALEAWGFANGADLRMAALCAAGAVGMVVGVARAWVTFFRMVRGRRAT